MFEPFPGNYVWNLATNLALVCGGNHGEIDEVNRPIMEAASADADLALGYGLSAGTKYLRPSGYYLAAERMQSRDYAPRWAAYEKGLQPYYKGSALRGLHVERSKSPTRAAPIPRSSSTTVRAPDAPRWCRSTASIR